MANINGNEIYFGIIGEIGSAAPIGEMTAYFAGTSRSTAGAAEYETAQGG